MSEKNIIDTAINNLLQDKALRGDSVNWANWMSKLTLFTCRHCAQQHGKIVNISMLENKTEVTAHKNCQCEYLPMRTKMVGTATNWGDGGGRRLFVLFWTIARLLCQQANCATSRMANNKQEVKFGITRKNAWRRYLC